MEIKLRETLEKSLATAVDKAFPGVTDPSWEISLEHPAVESHGDYSTNIALKLARKSGRPPLEIAELIVSRLKPEKSDLIAKIAIAPPGFINFQLRPEVFMRELWKIGEKGEKYGRGAALVKDSGEPKRIMVEFAHPNPLKPFHIGHLRNITTGESIVRMLENQTAQVIRANYQGDVGLHIAKAVWGILQMTDEYQQVKSKSLSERVRFLGQAYVYGNKAYEENEEAKKEITAINKSIYIKDRKIMPIWEEARRWSLEHFDEIYKRVYTHFDRLYFESEVSDPGKKIVVENVGKVFKESDGAIIFEGEKTGLHNRVFITSEGNPTYEGKEMGLAKLEFGEYDPDLVIHVVGPEQASFFSVTFEATAQVFPETRGKAKHLVYGFVQLKHGKMSSRKGNVILGEWLLDEVKARLQKKYSDRMENMEPVAIAACKYSFLKVDLPTEIAFDIGESINLEGDSGPYLQYTYARCQSVIAKSNSKNQKDLNSRFKIQDSRFTLNSEELSILRWLYRFPEVVEDAARQYAPNLVCSYLFELAQRYNTFYHKHSILEPETRIRNYESGIMNQGGKEDENSPPTEEIRSFRLLLTSATAQVIKNGLYLLGIEAPEKM